MQERSAARITRSKAFSLPRSWYVQISNCQDFAEGPAGGMMISRRLNRRASSESAPGPSNTRAAAINTTRAADIFASNESGRQAGIHVSAQRHAADSHHKAGSAGDKIGMGLCSSFRPQEEGNGHRATEPQRKKKERAFAAASLSLWLRDSKEIAGLFADAPRKT